MERIALRAVAVVTVIGVAALLGAAPSRAAHAGGASVVVSATAPSLPDLVPTTVTLSGGSFPVQGQNAIVVGAGRTASVSFSVANNGTADAIEPWDDTVYLSTDTTLDASD